MDDMSEQLKVAISALDEKHTVEVQLMERKLQYSIEGI